MAKQNFLVDVDLNDNQLLTSLFETLAADPGSLTEARFWYNSTDKRLKYYNGTATLIVADLSDVTGTLKFQGGYNATTNTPNLTAPAPGAIKTGYYWVVTVTGTFFGTTLEVGDSLFANIDDPAVLADWTIVQANVSYATETTAGIIKLATQVLTDAGTDDLTAVTPLKLTTFMANKAFTKKFVQTPVSIGTVPGVQLITHNLNTINVQVEVYDTTTSERYVVQVVPNTPNTVQISANGATKTVRVNVIG
jgi:hypothetical protein